MELVRPPQQHSCTGATAVHAAPICANAQQRALIRYAARRRYRRGQ